MGKKFKITVFILVAVELFLLGTLVLGNVNFWILSPKGQIASQQRDIIITAVTVMLLLVAPVYFMVFYTAFKYRSGHKKKYLPDKTAGKKVEVLWWIIPTLIAAVLAVLTWNSTHKLDPYKPLEATSPPLRIQVVALQWKWLFIYPEENIATVNYIRFPEDTPLAFELTSDAPMNSFWIPSLGGQMYAMTGMVTKLHLIADEQGVFDGSAAEISGKGFSKMRFKAAATSREDYDDWINSIKEGKTVLDSAEYDKLSKPSEDTPPLFYSSVESGLYDGIVMKFMLPKKNDNNTGHNGH